MLRDPPHYLRSLASTGTPRRLLWLDCAAVHSREQGAFVDRWHSAALGSTHWTSKKNIRKDALDCYRDPAAMWQAADGFCVKGRRTVLFAYDLAYQLRISQALVHMPALGWTLDKIVLERTAAWCLLRDGTRSLLMCDLKSWAPVSLDKLRSDVNGGEHIKATHPAGRKWQAAVAAARVQTIRSATLEIFAWIEAENLGPFRPTGSGQSYAAYRRRFNTHRLLVHDDQARLEIERVAMHTGRCEAWQHGTLKDGPYVEYDMHAAYCTIGRDCEVPTQAVGAMHKPNAERLDRAIRDYSVMADVTITTDVPVVPCKVAGRTVWPTGTFRTVLWDPELSLALLYAKQVDCHRAWKYKRGPALHDFAAYVLDGMGAQTQVYGLVPQRVLKHWSRCLVGRLGLRFRSWEHFGTCDEPDLRLVTLIDVEAGQVTDLLCAGTNRLILTEMSESTESLPQIPGWVASECRRRLWDAMTAATLDRVVYVDTDSIIVNEHAPAATPPISNVGHPGTWLVKGRYSRLTVHGPRNLEVESERRMSGLPLTARQNAPLEFTGEIMRSIKESMRAGELDCVASMPRRFHMNAVDLRRQHNADGTTQPYRLESPCS